MSSIEQLVGTLGFPIAVSIYLLYSMNRNHKENREDKNKTIEVVTKSINNNTVALTKLTTLIEKRVDSEH